MTRITFHGAAETVTGSKYLLEAGAARVLIDCGLFQGLKPLRELNWKSLPFDPRRIDAVVLTHAHIDHIGYLPRFVREGYDGPVYATEATVELAGLLLPDAAVNQERDADYANKKGYSKHKPALPLYSKDDARDALKLLKPKSRETWHHAFGPIWYRYHDAGHLLGSCMIEVEVRDQNPPLRILFSGDVGRYHGPLYHDPQPPTPCDVLICESTYGDRDHPPDDMLESLARVVNEAVRRGGVMLMASFAVGRAQQLVYLLEILIRQRRIPPMPIAIDSPMAVDATRIFCEHRDEHDLSEAQLTGPDCVLDGPNLVFAHTADESKRLNRIAGPAVIISSSGMMTGGRILHHLKQRLPDPKNTILLGGYQAIGTRGRMLQDGAQYLRIHGEEVPVRAAIAKVSGLSGHAGRSELLRWLEPLAPPRRTFITHGELPVATLFAQTLRDKWQSDVIVPRLGEAFEL
jgi:metallo-beta-lactamase family protein